MNGCAEFHTLTNDVARWGLSKRSECDQVGYLLRVPCCRPQTVVPASFLVHATGLAALGVSVRSTTHRCDRELHRNYLVAGVLWALNGFLLGATTSVALSGR